MKRVLFLIPIILIACASKPDPEQQGQQKLGEARQLYAAGNYSAARDTILSMRQNFPTAIEARRQAILLMDSVELQLAQGDTLKTEFYRRKLAFDKEGLKNKE
ncbi:MAG: hypothetical protein J6Y39_06350 [Bacteroidaceae bacterium]|nr:hypothetical protein [Bacteroidaceae bacterium]